MAALRVVYGDGVRQHQLIQFTPLVVNYPIFELDEILLVIKLNPDYSSNLQNIPSCDQDES